MNTNNNEVVDLSKIKHIHFVGIKGVGMCALSIVAKERGFSVSGSDVKEVFPTDETLNKFNIKFFVGFKKEHVLKKSNLVIYTGAHGGNANIEVVTAKNMHIPILPHGKALGLFMDGKKGISVAGAHGKTTTSAMIAHVLKKGDFDPSFAVGCGQIFSLGTPGYWGKGDYFVAEADEYMTDPQNDKTPRFLWQRPYGLVITNIEYDHPDAFKDIFEVEKAFLNFTKNVRKKGFVVCSIDNDSVANIIQKISVPVVTFGKEKNADFKFNNVNFIEGKTKFEASYKNYALGEFSLLVPGEHNVLNALATIATLHRLKIPLKTIKSALSTFIGTKRRFEFIGKKKMAYFYDDYAHHPTEIVQTLKAARGWFTDKRIIVLFQPHTYSRTISLLSEFAQCFSDADIVLIADIYPSAREKTIAGVSGQTLQSKVKKYHKRVLYAPKQEDVIKYLERNVRPDDIIINMGAGDSYTWLPGILEKL